ncbi:regulator of G-protein signaling 22 isoform X2 [Esox lucius]|uniref:Regulator of G protein signaling 22 n=1 Tax=Esox lucius TaxID=8010 RepID=A0A3P8ZFN6_ESOLU|nr:regulator of G-protein signaling 22 isoform X2 [Esox lucius]
MRGKTTTEPPCLNSDNFEDCLVSDDVLVHFFNEFLSLPSFPESVQYNKETGVFEVVSDGAEAVYQKIRSALRLCQSQHLNDHVELALRPMVDNKYTVLCLDREQGVKWIIKERLPLFIRSDCYFEYRLAKLLSQWVPVGLTQKKSGSSAQQHLSVPSESVSPSPGPEERETLLQDIYVSLGQDIDRMQLPAGTQSVVTPVGSLGLGESLSRCHSLHTLTCLSNSPAFPQSGLQSPAASLTLAGDCFQADIHTEVTSSGQEEQRGLISASSSCIPDSDSCALSSPPSSVVTDVPLCSSVLDWESRQEAQRPDQETRVHLPETGTVEGPYVNYNPQSPSRSSPVTQLADLLVERGLRDSETDMDYSSTSPSSSRQEKTCGLGATTNHCRLMREKGIGSSHLDTDPDLGFYDDTGSIHDGRPERHGLEEFKEFLKGSPGEKLLNLWVDVERLKTLAENKRKIRHLEQMRSQYLLSSGRSRLSGETLTRLGLSTSYCWGEGRLLEVQPHLAEALISYWGQRFRLSQSNPKERARDSDVMSPWGKRQLHPLSGVNPCYFTLHPLRPLRPHSGRPTDRSPAHSQPGYGSSSPDVGNLRRDRMLQALHVDSKAGFYFTQYCERSGNQLWENAIHFWFDLQQYHLLFYHDGLDPYRVQRQAQLLYSTYVCSDARCSVDVEEEVRRRVYACLTPPFEELFDAVEEYSLTLLMEPWTQLTTTDTLTHQGVGVWERSQEVESEQYRRLQRLYEESTCRLEQRAAAGACRPPPPPLEVPRSPALWAAVAERFRGYRLGSLLRHHVELQHFTSFLQHNKASVHLECWLDLEHFRRIPHKDTAVREDGSKLIKDKYLSRKYFFGPESPATREQQDDVMRLAGGWGRLLHERLCGPVLLEVQNIVRSHIESRWLPLFLATPAFTERQQPTVKHQGEDGPLDRVYQRHRKRTERWKQLEGTWMTSAGGILAFRQALLNPVTCHQFRRFVSLKGDFLENDVLFWLEVQRYKDLCHSHCDETVVQDKVSIIISCFIQSSIPPALQIDIPPEQAKNILEKRTELGPYIFREAQMCVFSELLKLWPEFLLFRSSVAEEEVLPELENRRLQQRARLQRHRRREEENRAQEEVERFPEGETVTGVEQKQKEWESRELLHPNQQLSWSYSKYLIALEREEVLLRRQKLGADSSSTSTDSSSVHSQKSKGGSRRPVRQRAQEAPAFSRRDDIPA